MSQVKRSPEFKRFWVANLMASSGGEIARFLIQVVAITLLAATPAQMGILAAAGYAGTLPFSPFAGVFVDATSRRRTLMTSLWLRAALMSTLAASLILWRPSIWVVILLVAGLSFVDVFFDAAHFSYVRELVGADSVGQAIGDLQVTDQVARVAIPGVVGVLLRWVSAPIALIAVPVLQALGGLLVHGLPDGHVGAKSDSPLRSIQTFMTSLREGFRFIRGNQIVLGTMLSSGVMNFAAGGLVAVHSLFALRNLGLSPAMYGMIMSAGAVTAAASGFFAPRIGRRVGEAATMLTAAATLPVSYLLLVLANFVPGYAVALLLLSEAAFGFLILLYGIQNASLSACVTPDQLMGRVSSSRRLISIGALPLGSLLGGAISQFAGVPATLIAMLCLSMLIPVPLLVTGIGRLWRSSLADVREQHAPVTEPRSDVVG